MAVKSVGLTLCLCFFTAVLGRWSAIAADSAPVFQKDEGGGFRFDTGGFRGRLRADGKSQGIHSLVDAESGRELVHGPGVLSLYRVFSSGIRYGDAARAWPVKAKEVDGGAVELFFPAQQNHPLDLTAVYRWVAADTLDLAIRVTPRRGMTRFELFLSSYFAKQSRGYVYAAPNFFSQEKPRLLPVDVNPLVDGTYLIFPRDRRAILTIFDGRWELPPHPVQWSITRRMAGPLVVRRDQDVVVALMARPQDCFAVSAPYNKTPPDGPSGHASLYLSLFGGDLPRDQTVEAQVRMVLGRDLPDDEIVARYEQFLAR
jgi:hypothetical protein